MKGTPGRILDLA